LEALLDQHYSVSVSTFDDSKSRSHTASLSGSAFTGLGKRLGRVGAFLMAGVGLTSSSIQLKRDLKATAGAQGLFINSKSASHAAVLSATLLAGLGTTPAGSSRLGGVRGYPLSFNRSWNLRLNTAVAGSTLVRQPDGSIEGERFVEHTNFEKFEKVMGAHREKWIEAGIAKLGGNGVSPAALRILSEQALDDFMENAKKGMASKTASFEESMKVKPEVAAQLSSNFALEEIARRENRLDDALALQHVRDEILAQDSSYEPFFLKAIIRSSIAQKWGPDLGFFVKSRGETNATRLFDFFPRPAKPTMYADSI
jgi:hypothetical protein